MPVGDDAHVLRLQIAMNQSSFVQGADRAAQLLEPRERSRHGERSPREHPGQRLGAGARWRQDLERDAPGTPGGGVDDAAAALAEHRTDPELSEDAGVEGSRLGASMSRAASRSPDSNRRAHC